MNSLEPKLGLGTQLLEAVAVEGRKAGCKRAVLVTANDNLDALGFYQRRGWQLSGLTIGGADIARRLKPSIPTIANNGIPIRDEIEPIISPLGLGPKNGHSRRARLAANGQKCRIRDVRRQSAFPL